MVGLPLARRKCISCFAQRRDPDFCRGALPWIAVASLKALRHDLPQRGVNDFKRGPRAAGMLDADRGLPPARADESVKRRRFPRPVPKMLKRMASHKQVVDHDG